VSWVDFGLGIAGLEQDKIAEVDAALPGFSRLAAELKQAEPILKQAKPHLDALEPLLIQLWPIVQKAWPDILAVTPAATDLADLADKTE
jgi:hypothetical protein